MESSEFLKALDENREREIYVRLTALSWNELPIETIEGRATGGTINIDGSSAIRRTCNLSLVAQELNIHEFYWGIKSKFRLEIGLKNTIDSSHDDIIWFNQGIYVFTSFNTTHGINNYTISISGKDKMCLLNGELGGNLYASIDFGTQEIIDKDNNIVYRKIPIYEILLEGIHTYALEPYENIVINDLDELGLELLEYRGSDAIYVFIDRSGNDTEAVNISIDESKEFELVSGGFKKLKDFSSSELDNLFNLDSSIQNNPLQIKVNTIDENGNPVEKRYTVAKIEYGQAMGYRPTQLVYAGELISSVGEAFTSILDKIKNMLVDFEYFYDIDGRFIFQRKATYINKSWSPIKESENDQFADFGNLISYYFENSNLITSYSHNPQLNNVKNDYSIWGARKGVGDAEIPIHFRYAIDKKPEYYKNIEGIEFIVSDNLDWREIIYQMALDYFLYHTQDDFLIKIAKNNPNHYPLGITGYEQYYTDIQGFWRQIYDQGFKTEIIEHPENLNFWFDFLDTSGELGQFSVQNIGLRTKSVNDKDVKSIYNKEIPKLVFNDGKNKDDYSIDAVYDLTGYTPVNWGNSNLESVCTISAQGKSAKDKLDELLYQHGYCSESITIQAIPVYYLNPNTRIYVRDDLSGINGQYLVSRITLPLTYNGTMSITATKVPERII